MANNKTKFWIGFLIAFILGWGANHFYQTKSIKIEDKVSFQSSTPSSVYKPNIAQESSSKFPDYVLETLEYVRENNEAPSGYVVGRTFQNRENQLPKIDNQGKKIQYREWDVHPKKGGQNRGAERLVTSDNGDAYYTKDHFQSFIKIP